MFFQVILTVVATFLFTLTARAARQARESGAAYDRFRLLWGIVLLGFVGYVALTGYLAVSLGPELAWGRPLTFGLIVAAATAFAVFLWLVVTGERLREGLSLLFPRARTEDTPLEDLPWRRQIRGFDPNNPVHACALGLILLFFLQTLLNFLLVGGQAGLAEAELSQGEVLLSSGLTMIMLLSVSLAGVGAWQDRAWPDVRARLGLRLPTLAELTVGAGAALLLIAFQADAGRIWMQLTSEEVVQQQTQFSQAIAGSITSLTAAFLIALFAALGEEVAFRGALQPVLGLWPTAILFALTHIQYQLSPAALIIFVIGLALGYVRLYFGTVAAIVAHFLYDFGLLALVVLLGEMLNGG